VEGCNKPFKYILMIVFFIWLIGYSFLQICARSSLLLKLMILKILNLLFKRLPEDLRQRSALLIQTDVAVVTLFPDHSHDHLND
jgi:hypothetical protein